MEQMREPITSVAHGPVVSVGAACTLREAAKLMRSESIGALGVRGENGIVAIFSERDLLEALATGADPDTATVGEHMSVTLIAARPHDTVLDVALLMLDDAIRHVPVVDDYGRDMAMVSLRDLLRPMLLQAMTTMPG